jgi:hypothetical protein
MAQSKSLPPNHQPQSLNLDARVERYRELVEKVVQEMGEHPECELKRSYHLETKAQKIEFVKDIQSVATSRIETEKLIVIGADEDSRSFCGVTNPDEFDDARIRDLLGKYLVPIPEFEVFRLKTSKGVGFVLFAIPKQRTRRILAKCTVNEDAPEGSRRLLLREGDLWTKGTSSAKRLATPDDWDEIYEEFIEREVEKRANLRTAHFLDRAVAQERLRASTTLSSLPSFTTDEEFGTLVEGLCSSSDKGKFRVLLERIRDDVVESWHSIANFEGKSLAVDNQSLLNQLRDHKRNVFVPGIQRLASAGILIVKNRGPVDFLKEIVDLLKEVYETSYRPFPQRVQYAMQNAAPLSSPSPGSAPREPLGHTVPALESLIALHLMGAFIFKRSRYEYIRSLFRADVYRIRADVNEMAAAAPMAFWPLTPGPGELEQLNQLSGRINLCADRVAANDPFTRLFGSRQVALEAFCQYEFCLELNSFLCISTDGSPDTAAYTAKSYPEIGFYFWPSLIAFPFAPIMPLALRVYEAVLASNSKFMDMLVFDDAIAGMLCNKAEKASIYGAFLRTLAQQQAEFFLSQHRFPPMNFWPEELGKLIKSA